MKAIGTLNGRTDPVSVYIAYKKVCAEEGVEPAHTWLGQQYSPPVVVAASLVFNNYYVYLASNRLVKD